MKRYIDFTKSDEWKACKESWEPDTEVENQTDYSKTQMCDEQKSSNSFDITAEKWVELYGEKIQHIFKNQAALVDHINKLRARYEDAVLESQQENRKNWKTAFLRNNVCGSKVTWITNRLDISLAMIEDLFGKSTFSKNQLSNAKK